MSKSPNVGKPMELVMVETSRVTLALAEQHLQSAMATAIEAGIAVVHVAEAAGVARTTIMRAQEKGNLPIKAKKGAS